MLGKFENDWVTAAMVQQHLMTHVKHLRKQMIDLDSSDSYEDSEDSDDESSSDGSDEDEEV